MSCYRCICATCANNVERINAVPGEADFGCINCDTCAEYIGYYAGSHNKKTECGRHKLSVAGRAETARADALRRKRAAREEQAARAALRASFTVIEGVARKEKK